MTLKKMNLEGFTPTYENAGQKAEQLYRYTEYGLIIQADNMPHTIAGDCGKVQIKTARATIATDGLSIEEYLEKDAAELFAYVMVNLEYAVLMDKAEYLKFANTFKVWDASRNKWRLDRETQQMKKYFFKLFH